MANDPDFVYVTYIQAPIEKIWEALMSPEFTRQYWFNNEISSTWKEGAPITYVMNGETKMDGKVLKVERPNLLSYTFHETNGAASHEPPTTVTIKLDQELGTKTVQLTVTHTDFVANSKHRTSISNGWPAVLSGLKTLLETGEVLKFEM